ncbi:unnamed protein product [Enterobius vermicularis]|uniref:DNA-directed RNA polymerase I subunit RPA1 n=1 Tax=Enterobius vermicularis TaxID=51028 RepID=A0A0N4V107_ENTVE|nr:unnamed protein product [Enterobius vermicularis]
MMLMNRQPSLHKPSIMGHRARIIKNQRAMRLNYAPCKAYNADFDGDEMNGHFLQDFVAQTEAANIMNVGSNFLVPKDGTPLLGLIQDHVVSGVKLTIRGRFFNREDFMYLVLSAFAETRQRFRLPTPAIIKPKLLWSGKQIISTVLMNCIPEGKQLINLTSKAKTPLSCWKARGGEMPGFNMSESEVVFRNAELLVGVLDKQHYGSTQYGLVHCCWDLYGGKCATRILSCFSRLFTTFLQIEGFTLGVADILVRKEEDKIRTGIIRRLRRCGDKVARECFKLPADTNQQSIKMVVANAYCNPQHNCQSVQLLDFKMKELLNTFGEQITKTCVPSGLVRQFPENALQTMILCGSKGTMVNSVQISCGLGQIELEGHRPPVTAAGRTLPSFFAFETSPRAGGFVDQRFLTGISPQELFFHTMAGREGLIDTAVKTSRSGYLQRCIVKHLEGLVVNYDSTVRDHDNSVIQFRYGEDGMDVCKCTFLNSKQLKFLSQNMDAVRSSVIPSFVSEPLWDSKKSEKIYRKIRRWRKKSLLVPKKCYNSGFVEFSKKYTGTPKQEITAMWFGLSEDERNKYERFAGAACPRMIDEKLDPNRSLGALPEKMLDDLDEFIKNELRENPNFPSTDFRRIVYWKGLRSNADPGENVGLLAAQSVGEPSTQMTLNTFHFAGRGEMNVTLGIPRLREILMTSGSKIGTPNAEICVKPDVPQAEVDKIKRELGRVYLKQVIRRITVEERLDLRQSSSRNYDLRIEVVSSKARPSHLKHIKSRYILMEIESRFVKSLARLMRDRSRELQTYEGIQSKSDAASSDEEADTGKDADAGEVRLNKRHLDDAADYEGEEDEKNVIEVEEENEPASSDVGEEEGELNSVEMESDECWEAPDHGGTIVADQIRIQAVISSSSIVSNYRFDNKHNRWCIITFRLPLNTKTRLDVVTLVERELETFVVYGTPGVEKCIQREENHNNRSCQILATQGINAEAFFRHSKELDVNTFYTNDLNLMWKNYGEIVRVFQPYGIDVNRRHLTLTADYMTFTGRILPFTRGALSSGVSPLQKMTFETTVSFMRDAIVNGDDDYLTSPSAKIVVGRLLRGGTGVFDLLVPSDYYLGVEDKPGTFDHF